VAMRDFLGTLGMICMFVLCPMGLGIHLVTIYYAYFSSFWAAVASLIFPFFSQLYWIWQIWSATDVFFNFLMVLCLTWVAIAALGMILFVVADTRSQGPSTAQRKVMRL